VRSPDGFMTNDRPTEKRLDQLREEAWSRGAVGGGGVDVAGGPIPKHIGYYGQPVVKPPVWTWEIPVYFFVGGLAGMAAMIASAALTFGYHDLARSALRIAAIGVVLSAILLILDLGRPRLFINMLRVFKPQSAMSMGAWILTFLGASVIPAVIMVELEGSYSFAGVSGTVIHFAVGFFAAASAIFGILLATYTGVLLGTTAIPAWFLHRIFLPVHFGTIGLGSATGLLELCGYQLPVLNAIGLYSAGIETVLAIWLSMNRHGAADRAVHHGSSGQLIRVGGILSGPLALAIRLLGQVHFAAISFLLGALLSRFGWLQAGKVSGCDPEAVFASQR
jgi:formate-dependent nitrite reductase membrane component NrfD